jgi:hypothetical protein
VADLTPGVTGRILYESSDSDAITRWVIGDTATGDEYGVILNIHREARLHQWGLALQYVTSPEGVTEPADEEEEDAGSLVSVARSMARIHPAIEIAAPAIPELSGNLVEDVRAVSGLTYAQIAGAYGISERAVAGWRASGVPRHRRVSLEAVRSIGLTLIAGLGKDRVAEWLLAGTPSRLERVMVGDTDSVVGDARRYEYSPAT